MDGNIRLLNLKSNVMKKLSLVLFVLTLLGNSTSAHHYSVVNGYGDSFVFNEDGITFSVYPDGEFDFFIEPVINSVCVNTAIGGFTFNTGYDYSPFLQYDDYGAVIQVENVPIYYDYYGRVSQIGNVPITYRNRRVCQVGGLVIYYNNYGRYTHCTGYINAWNPYFVYRPFYTYFTRPVVNLCLVRYNPYRIHYQPVRHVYYRPYAPRVRPHYATVGHTYTPNGNVVSTYYRQAPRSSESAYHRGHTKITREYVAKNPSRLPANSTGKVSSDRSSVASIHHGKDHASTRTNTGSKMERPVSSASRTQTNRGEINNGRVSQSAGTTKRPASNNVGRSTSPKPTSSRVSHSSGSNLKGSTRQTSRVSNNGGRSSISSSDQSRQATGNTTNSIRTRTGRSQPGKSSSSKAANSSRSSQKSSSVSSGSRSTSVSKGRSRK